MARNETASPASIFDPSSFALKHLNQDGAFKGTASSIVL
jgi:hypothetical protein